MPTPTWLLTAICENSSRSYGILFCPSWAPDTYEAQTDRETDRQNPHVHETKIKCIIQWFSVSSLLVALDEN